MTKLEKKLQDILLQVEYEKYNSLNNKISKQNFYKKTNIYDNEYIQKNISNKEFKAALDCLGIEYSKLKKLDEFNTNVSLLQKEFDNLTIKFNVKIDYELNKKSIYKIFTASKEKDVDSYYILSYKITIDNFSNSEADNLIINDFSLKEITNILLNKIHFMIRNKEQDDLLENIDYEDIVLSPKAAAFFIHECIGHFLEADHFIKSPLRLLNINFGKKLDVIENYTNRTLDDSFFKIKKNIKLIDCGQITNLLGNNTTKKMYRIPNTGNTFFEDNSNGLLPRMISLKVNSSNTNDIVELRNPLYIEDTYLGEVDIYSGEFSVEVTQAFLKNSGTYVKPFVLNFNIRDFLFLELIPLSNSKKVSNLCSKTNGLVKVDMISPEILIRTANYTKNERTD